MLFKHRRGSKAVGTFVDLPYIDQRVNVRGDGTFSIPDDAPPQLIKFLREQARHSRVLPPAPPQPKPQQTLPTPEIKPDPIEAKKSAAEYPDYPEELTQVQGVGKRTAENVGKTFPTPKDILSYEGKPTQIRGLTLPSWLRIKDFIASKYTEE